MISEDVQMFINTFIDSSTHTDWDGIECIKIYTHATYIYHATWPDKVPIFF